MRTRRIVSPARGEPYGDRPSASVMVPPVRLAASDEVHGLPPVCPKSTPPPPPRPPSTRPAPAQHPPTRLTATFGVYPMPGKDTERRSQRLLPCLSGCRVGLAGLAPAARDREPAVAPEVLRRDLGSGRVLPALPLGQVDKADHR